MYTQSILRVQVWYTTPCYLPFYCRNTTVCYIFKKTFTTPTPTLFKVNIVFGASFYPQQTDTTVKGTTTVMFPESGSLPSGRYFCPFTKTPDRQSRKTSRSVRFFHQRRPDCPGPSRKLPPARAGAAGERWLGVPARPLPSQKSKCEHFLSFRWVCQPNLVTAQARPLPPLPVLGAPTAPTPRPCSPSGSSTVRARRSERVRRLSCSIALSILGAPSALLQPRQRPLRPVPYIPPRPGPRAKAAARPCHRRHCGDSSGPRPPSGYRGCRATTKDTPATTAAHTLPAAATASRLDSHGILGTVVLS